MFVDELAFDLFVLAFGAFLLAYLLSDVYLSYRKKHLEVKSRLLGLSVPIGIIGVYLLIVGIVSQLSWFLPGPYNMLFYDPMVAFGLILVAFSLGIRYNLKLDYIGFLALMAGIMTIWYGISGYKLGLTKTPLEFLGLFVLYGVAGILTWPVLMMFNRVHRGIKTIPLSWQVIIATLWVVLILSGIAAAIIGGFALPGHLANPP
ncbi:DUF981 domain-containing protein [Candidatus Parvarchaeota archaeon]|nr:DUF981 domain-containing protein [Candidatus Parvarchaeota archaeon]